MPEQTTPEVTTPAAPAAESTPAPAAPESAPESPSTEGLTSMADALKGFDDIGLGATDGIETRPRSNLNGDTKAPADKKRPAPPVEHQFQPDQSARAAKLAKVADPADRERLAKMSNAAFDKYYKLTLDLQDGNLVPKSKVDEAVAAKVAEFEAQKGEALSSRYFDHEEGYRLTPEYRQAEGAITQLSQERSFWNTQLSNVRAGKPFKTLEVDDKGQPRPSRDEFDPKDPEAEGYLIGKITQATTMIEDRRRTMSSIPTQHKEMHTKFTGIVSQLDKQLFETATAPAFVEKTKKMLEQFPAPLRGRPEIQLIAKTLAGGEMLLAKINQLEATQTKNVNVTKALSTSAPAPLETAAAAGGEDDTAQAVKALDRIAASSAGSFY